MKDDITWINIQKLYLENHRSINALVNHISGFFDIPKKIVRDQIKKEFIAMTEKPSKANIVINFIRHYTFLFFILFSGIVFIFQSKKKVKADVLFEELWDQRSLYSRFYNYIDNYLPKQIKSGIVLNFPGYSKNAQADKIEHAQNKDIFDIRQYNLFFKTGITLKIFFFSFFYFFQLLRYKTINLDLFLLYLKLVRKILIYTTQASLLETKILISAADYYWNPFKYYFFKQGGVKNILLIQHNFVGDYIVNNFYLSCDYYFAHSQLAINKKIGFYNKNQFPIGSLQLSPFLEKSENILYDLLIIDQPVHELIMVKSRDGGDKDAIIKQFYSLLNNIKNYLMIHKNKKAIYVLKPNAMKKETFHDIKNIFHDVENIIFKEVYGKQTFNYVAQSRLILNMYSSVGIEAYGLDKKVLWINYDNCCDIFKYDVEQEDLHILIHDTSYDAFEKRVDMLLSDTLEVNEHYAKLKEKYMNIQENPASVIANKICELVGDI